MIKLYTGCLVLIIGNLIVGQVVLTFKMVKYDMKITQTWGWRSSKIDMHSHIKEGTCLHTYTVIKANGRLGAIWYVRSLRVWSKYMYKCWI